MSYNKNSNDGYSKASWNIIQKSNSKSRFSLFGLEVQG